MPASATRLVGLTLDNGWKVLQLIPKAASATGGNFSFSYIVENPSGRKAFLKALDFSRAMMDPDPARMLQALTESYNFERDVLQRCRLRHLDRVVTAIDDGTVRVTNPDDFGVVPYLIFDLADGDVRSQIDLTKRLDLAWALRSLHHVATGLWQLHGSGIAHQDLKPSNVLLFGPRDSRLADFGRASIQGQTPPHEGFPVAGDPTYAPPELLYRHVDPDWHHRRCGCDAYLLGSMITFFFAGAAMTPMLVQEIPTSHAWFNWPGTYTDALPYVRGAFSRVIQTLRPQFEETVRDDLTRIVTELCEPDPLLRGHPKNRGKPVTQYSMERYVSTLNLLATRAECSVGRAGP